MSAELASKRWRNRRLKPLPGRAISAAGWVYTTVFFTLSEILFRAPTLSVAGSVFSPLIHWHSIHDAAELFAYKGPFDFALALLTIPVWLVLAPLARRETQVSTPVLAFTCALLVLFLGRLGSGRFIYAGF
jgi:hypothetical protein